MLSKIWPTFYCSELRDYINRLLAKTLPDESPNRREQEKLRRVVRPASHYVYRTNGGIDIAMTDVANEDNIGHFIQWMSHVQQYFIDIIDAFGSHSRHQGRHSTNSGPKGASMGLSFTASPDTDSSGKDYDAIVLLSAGCDAIEFDSHTVCH